MRECRCNHEVECTSGTENYYLATSLHYMIGNNLFIRARLDTAEFVAGRALVQRGSLNDCSTSKLPRCNAVNAIKVVDEVLK
jgi:hypothetical protein